MIMTELDLDKRLPELRIGTDSGDLSLSRSEEHYKLLLTMVQQGARSLLLYGRYLDGKLYDQAEFIDAVRNLAIQHPQTRVRILIRDIEPLVKHGHRIVELARHLSSYMEIRQIHSDYAENNEAFSVVDERAVIYRKLSDRYEGIANFNNPNHAQLLSNYFNEVWEHSQQPTDVRRLFL